MGLDFNLVLLGFAVVSGALAAAVGIALSHKRGVSVATVVGGGLALFVFSFIAVAADRNAGRMEFFGIVHLAYLMATVAIPLAAAAVLAWSWWSRTARTATATLILGAAILLAPIGLYASHIEPFWLRIDRHGIDLDLAGPPVRIGVLSDLQTPSVGDYERDAIASLVAEQPDIVLVPGDFWQTPSGRLDAAAADGFHEVFELLDGEIEHVIVVEGDTDDVYGLRELADGTGVIVLENEVVQVEVDGQEVRIGGLSLDETDPDRGAVIAEVAGAPDGVLRVILAHQPGAVFDLGDPNAIDLVVSGHTHGGQIAVPLFGPLVTLSEVPRSVAAGGLHVVAGTSIYVSTGVGRERRQAPQVRFLVRPSIGVIDVS